MKDYKMKELTDKDRKFLEELTNRKPQEHNGYMVFNCKRKHYKRSRVLLQLHLNKKFEIWENVHHKNENKQDDRIENLEIMKTEEHISNHRNAKK